LKKKAVVDIEKAAGGPCHSIGTVGDIRQNDECGAAAIPARMVAEYVLANTRARALERE
jgi:hypothetical protein